MAANTVIFRQVLLKSTPCIGVRNMATLKDISLRLKSIKNIQKITKSMKMVSAAKYAKAERELKPAKIYGTGVDALHENSEVTQDASKPNHLILTVSSDRGLCGGIHSGIAKAVRASIAEKPGGTNVKIVAVGDKMRQILSRQHSDKFLLQFNDIGRLPPTFAEAAFIAQEILDSGYEFDHAEVFYNRFRSVVSYQTSTKPVFSLDAFANSEHVSTYYDDMDGDVLKNYQEFNLASMIYYCLKEGATSEQSSRMTAMESASKNAGEIIDKLTLTYNRTRQAVITRELIEIISGAAALD